MPDTSLPQVSPLQAGPALIHSDTVFLERSPHQAWPSLEAVSSCPTFGQRTKERQVGQGSWQIHPGPGSLDVSRERCSHHAVTKEIFWKILSQEGL